MPTYVALVSWTDQGARNAKDTVVRAGQTSTAIEQAGGRLIGYWWTQGAYDAVVVIEWPDDETASAAALTLAIGGNARSETMRAFTYEEMQRIINRLP